MIALATVAAALASGVFTAYGVWALRRARRLHASPEMIKRLDAVIAGEDDEIRSGIPKTGNEAADQVLVALKFSGEAHLPQIHLSVTKTGDLRMDLGEFPATLDAERQAVLGAVMVHAHEVTESAAAQVRLKRESANRAAARRFKLEAELRVERDQIARERLRKERERWKDRMDLAKPPGTTEHTIEDLKEVLAATDRGNHQLHLEPERVRET